MHEDRVLLRRLLRALITERADSAMLYVPRGEAGQRRMIDALLALRPAQADDPLAQEIGAYRVLQAQGVARQRAGQQSPDGGMAKAAVDEQQGAGVAGGTDEPA